MAEIPHDWPVPLPKWVWAWMKWRLQGRSYPRPATVPPRIPKWAWHRLQWLVSLRESAPPPPPPRPPLAELARNVMFTAWAPSAALLAPLHWKVALSADPAYDAAVRAAAPLLREAGHLIAVWGNQSQTGAARIRTLADDLDADFVIFQAETAGEYDTAMAAGARIIVGNPNSWTSVQREDSDSRSRRGDLAVMFEVYTNAGNPWPDVANPRAVIACEVLGVGGWAGRPDLQLEAYRAHTPPGTWANMSVYTAEYLSPASWEALP